MAQILLVEDEVNVREILSLSLASHGHDVIACADIDEAEVAMRKNSFQIILTDLRMRGEDMGLDVIQLAKEIQPNAHAILLTAYASAETAVEAMRHGAFDYITKPVSRTELGEVIERALSEPIGGPALKKDKVKNLSGNPRALIGQSTAMQRVRDRIEGSAKRNFTVLISGESGTGKELAAFYLHTASDRTSKPFVPVHCGAIPENLFESELFGHVKGAFTGADTDKMGLIESADGGTLFLDEIGEMPLLIQVKLLRVLQDMKVRRVGSEVEKQVNVRVVAATNRDLDAEVKHGNFREDLFYRLNVIPLHMPALRQRREDIPELVHLFLKVHGGANLNITDTCLKTLSELPLNGNVRELENLVQRLMALSDQDTLDEHLLSEILIQQTSPDQVTLDDLQAKDLSLDDYLEQTEKSFVQEALQRTRGNATKAAKLLKISFRSMRYRLEKLGIKEDKD